MEEQITKSEQIVNKESTEEIEKQSSRSWTQSEVDAHTAKLLNKELEKFKGYDDMKTQLDQLLTEKKAIDDSQKSETEKATDVIANLTERNTELELLTENFKKEQLRNSVLGDPKYSQLTKAYRNLVTLSSSDEEVRKAADAALEEYKTDFAGSAAKTFGIPAPKQDDVVKPSVVVDSADKMRNILKSKITSMLQK